MHSDKHNSIMATATGLISSLFNIASSGGVPFTNHSNFNACIMKLTFALFYAPFLSPLLLSWQLVMRRLWLQCKTWVSAVLTISLLTLFFAWNVTQSVWRAGSKMKCSHLYWGWVTHLIAGAHASMVEYSIISILTELIVEIIFMLFSVYNTV